jgi:hypothetical protein
MNNIITKASDRKHDSSIWLWSLGGFVIAALIGCADILPDFFSRLHVAATGGVGESSLWDEPLFYMVIIGIPAGLVGAAIAFAIKFVVLRLSKKNESHFKC